MAKGTWSELPVRTRGLVLLAGVVQAGLLVAAQLDLTWRPGDQVAGSKTAWRWATLINFVGPLAYFRRGRRRRATP